MVGMNTGLKGTDVPTAGRPTIPWARAGEGNNVVTKKHRLMLRLIALYVNLFLLILYITPLRFYQIMVRKSLT